MVTGCGDLDSIVAESRLPHFVGDEEFGPSTLAWRLLNRAAFGPRPGDLEEIAKMGEEAWLDTQLDPQNIKQPSELSLRLRRLDSLGLTPGLLREYNASNRQDEMVTPRLMDVLKVRQLFRHEPAEGLAQEELVQATILRATLSNRQLEEVLVEFWSDHFHISQSKGEAEWLKTLDDENLRPHVLGSFRELLNASAHSPAMMVYLDNESSSAGAQLNENYGRELLELHTLGVNSDYTLNDVQEVARCFTGWGMHGVDSLQAGTFAFRGQDHDDGDKVVLGQRIPAGGGQSDGELVLDMLASHTSTAHFLCLKLCRRFVCDEPPKELVDELAAHFLETDGDLRSLTRKLFLNPAFAAPENTKFKRPFDFIVSSLRATNATVDGSGIASELVKLGHLPFGWATPDGYPDEAPAWSSNLLGRWNFAIALLAGEVEGASVEAEFLYRATRTDDPVEACEALQRVVLGRAFESEVTDSFVHLTRDLEPAHSAERWLALALASPEFQVK
ncbi:MAG: hypothetical protein ACI9EF_003116 [Pseudohongiellaceae bacterium]|jgi:uncharacterized protein (DUF1800 family)